MLHLLPGSFILMRHLFAKRRRFAASRFLKHFVFLLMVCCWMLPLTAEASPLADAVEVVEVARDATPSALYPQSIVKPVQAHHRLHEQSPELVVEAIRQVAE
jgi:hypothetical protein